MTDAATSTAPVVPSNSLNTTELAGAVAKVHNIPRSQALRIMSSVFTAIGNATAEKKIVRIHNFGNFKAVDTKARKGRNLQNGAITEIPASTRPHFTSAQHLKNKVRDHKTEDLSAELAASVAAAQKTTTPAVPKAKPAAKAAAAAPVAKKARTPVSKPVVTPATAAPAVETAPIDEL